MEAGRGRRPARQARPARLRAVEGLEEGDRAGDRGLALAVGAGASRVAHRVLGDGAEVPRRRLRHPRRRRRPPLPAPRERAGAVARGRVRLRVVLDAQRVDHHLRREDEQVARQLADRARGARAGARRSTCGSTSSPRTTARTWSSRFEALEEAAAGFARIEHFLERARLGARLGGASGRWCADFEQAMDDDLGTPAAVAAIYDVVREGNKLLADGDSPALRGAAASVRAMLAVLGLDPFDPHWSARRLVGDRGQADARAVDALVAALLEQRGDGARGEGLRGRRRDPRPAQGGRHRARRTPRRARRGPCDRLDPGLAPRRAGLAQARPRRRRTLMPGNSARRGAIKKTGKGNPTAGSGGRVQRGLEGRGPDPEGQGPRGPRRLQGKASRREDRRAAAAAAAKPAPTPSGSPAATRVVEALRAHCRSPRCTSRRAPSATAGCARSSGSLPTAASRCSR